VFAAFAAVADTTDDLRERTRNGSRSIRYDGGDEGSRVLVTFDAPDPARTRVSVEHTRLADEARRRALKARWSTALDALKAQLEGSPDDA
jgi:hypothetical protein